MRASLRISRILLSHFFRRFFDNDTLHIDGDTTTTIARALAVVIAPGLLVAFFLQTLYSVSPGRSLLGRMEDQYFFVLESFVVMAAVVIFQWEMLFPDRIDLLVLTPLPLQRGQLLASKASALICFLSLFLFATNAFGALIYSAICRAPLPRQLLAHSIAVAMAGVFSSCAVLAIVGVLRLLLSDRLFRLATPALQALLTTGLALLVIQYARYGESIDVLLTSGSSMAAWVPTLWFLAVYDRVLYGNSVLASVPSLSAIACLATAASLILVILLYPMAWTRMHKMSVEGVTSRPRQSSPLPQRLIHLTIRRPAERAMFHFIGQTIRRSARYQIYLAMYGGAGLSLATACAFVLKTSRTSVAPVVSTFGKHAVVPLLIFWATAGICTAFSFPTTLPARWVFRVSGADSRDLVNAGWTWALAISSLVWSLYLFTLAGVGWTKPALTVQIVSGVCLGILSNDAFFLSRRVPLIEPRLPGRSNFVPLLTLYVGILTPAVFFVVWWQMRMEHNLWLLLPLLAGTITLHAAFRLTRRAPMEQEEEMEGYEGEFQLLNLS